MMEGGCRWGFSPIFDDGPASLGPALKLAQSKARKENFHRGIIQIEEEQTQQHSFSYEYAEPLTIKKSQPLV
jgi:hypothetical protein